jgi:hypothetical protein
MPFLQQTTFSNKLPDKLLCAKSLKSLVATNLDPMAKKRKIRSSQQQSAAVKGTGENLLTVGFHFEASESERRYHEPDHQAYQDDVTAAP